jgi:hypothetical protein
MLGVVRWLAPLAVFALLALVGSALVTRRPAAARFAGLGLAGVFPFTLPAGCPLLGLMLGSLLSVVWSIKIWERSHQRVADPRMFRSTLGFWLWWFVPPDARVPDDPAAALASRKAGLLRLRRGFVELGLFVVLLLFRRRLPELHALLPVYLAWSMLLLWSLITGIGDAVTGVAMQTGYWFDEVFERPLLSRSPRDFWSRRWNRFVHGFARRNVYVPLGGRERPIAAVLTVFVLSGLMHEWLVVACGRGFGSYTGLTFAFFVVHGVAVLAEARFGRAFPRALAIVGFYGFMFVTSPLFFLPLDEAIGFSRW